MEFFKRASDMYLKSQQEDEAGGDDSARENEAGFRSNRRQFGVEAGCRSNRRQFGVRWFMVLLLAILFGANVADEMKTPERKSARFRYSEDGDPLTPGGVIKTPGGQHGETPGGSKYLKVEELGRNKMGSAWFEDDEGAKSIEEQYSKIRKQTLDQK